MIEGSESTRRIHLAAFVTAFLSLLVFGLAIGETNASSAVVGPPAPTRTPAVAPADTQVPAASATTESEAEQVAAAPTKAPPTAGTPSADSGSGGVEPVITPPDNAVGGGSDGGNQSGGGNQGGGSKPAHEPAFVEQDPSLSGGVSPDDAADGDKPFVLDRLNVPNFVIDNFEIPPFLLPIYQACGSEYGIPWEVLASINRIETNFGTNVGTSTAGAYGWMQFIHSSWVEWGVDANGDKLKDPFNPVDAICAAGNYLQDFGYAEDPYTAIFAYNHADWYVQDILEHAKAYAAIPPEVISSLTGLTEGARFPIAAESSYAGQVSTEAAKKNGTASQDVSAAAGRTSIEISAKGGAPVIAVNDGIITKIDATTGTVVLKDVYGNNYSYAGLGSVAQVHPVPRERSPNGQATDDTSEATHTQASDDVSGMGAVKATDAKPGKTQADTDSQVKDEGSKDGQDGKGISEVLVDPDAAADAAAAQAAGAAASAPDSSGSAAPTDVAADRRAEQEQLTAESHATEQSLNTEDMRGRTYANPLRPVNQTRSTVQGQSVNNSPSVGGSTGVEGKPGDYVIYDGSKSGVYKFDKGTTDLEPLEKGSRVIAGTVLGRLAEQPTASINFSIKPSGDEAPEIDPKPFLDGWRLLSETNIYNAQGKDRFADRLGIGGVLLLSKTALQKRVLADPGLEIYECGRQDIANGFIDRRVLAMLEFLREKGFTMTITSLQCGHGFSTSSGNVSEHTTGTAVDIAVFNGQVVTPATQGPGTFIDKAARDVMSLQGAMAPHQVISLTDYGNGIGFAMSDHDDHLHVGFQPVTDGTTGGSVSVASLGAEQWERLTERLGQIQNPEVPTSPSQDALPAEKSEKGNPAGQSDKGK